MSFANTNSPSWQLFLRELRNTNIEFSSIQFADERTRASVLEALPALSVLDRAVVSSTWTQLAAATNSPARSSNAEQQLRASPSPHQESSPSRPLFAANAFPTMSPSDVNPAALRRSLTRGDCTIALPLASELLQKDPPVLVQVLHEFLPHMSQEQIRSLLGVTHGGEDSVVRDGEPSRSFVINSVEGAGSETAINGVSVEPGTIITRESIAAHYGRNTTVVCNGTMVCLPYCVQKGDQLSVRSLTD